MALKYTETKNNNQKQTAYVVYMIISSLFKKSVNSSQFLVDNLYLHYSDLPNAKQDSLLEKNTKLITKRLEDLVDVFADCNAEIHVSNKKDAIYISADTGIEVVTAKVLPSGIVDVDVEEIEDDIEE